MSCRSELSGISILTDYVRAGRADFPHLGFRCPFMLSREVVRFL